MNQADLIINFCVLGNSIEVDEKVETIRRASLFYNSLSRLTMT